MPLNREDLTNPGKFTLPKEVKEQIGCNTQMLPTWRWLILLVDGRKTTTLILRLLERCWNGVRHGYIKPERYCIVRIVGYRSKMGIGGFLAAKN